MSTTSELDSDNVIDRMRELLQLPLDETLRPHIVTFTGFLNERSRDKENLLKRHSVSVKYEKNSDIINEGKLASISNSSNCELRYANVPLGIILSGEVRIHESGNDVRDLSAGNFIGLFETCFWLAHTEDKGNTTDGLTGRWSVTATTETVILFFGKDLLRNGSSSEDNRQEAINRQKAINNGMKDFLLNVARQYLYPIDVTPNLPLLDQVVRKIDWPPVERCAVVCHFHLLPSAIGLLKHLANLVGADNIFVLEKSYSTVDSQRSYCSRTLEIKVLSPPSWSLGAYEDAAQTGIQSLYELVRARQEELRRQENHYTRLVLLDDGGLLTLSFPWDRFPNVAVTAVEQTSSGLLRISEQIGLHTRTPRTVNVATSAAKTHCESPIIADAIVRKLNQLGRLDKEEAIGILGLGKIGMALARRLTRDGHKIAGYDRDPEKGADLYELGGYHFFSPLDLLKHAHLVIGCSGSDTLDGVDLTSVTGEKWLVSASSSDIEFKRVLKLKGLDGVHSPFRTVTVSPDGTSVKLHCLNGGFPINFDRQQEWEPLEGIQLTRALLYAGVIQALLQTPCENANELDNLIMMLDPVAQRRIVARWKKATGDWLRDLIDDRQPTFRYLENEDWWAMESKGVRQEDIRLFAKTAYHLHFTTRKALDLMRQHIEPYVIEVYQIKKEEIEAKKSEKQPGQALVKNFPKKWELVVFPGVWSPLYDWSSWFHIEKLPPELEGKDFLEIGCGCGIVSLAAAFRGAKTVTAVDINPCAVKNTQYNFQKHGLLDQAYRAFESDVFSPVTPGAQITPGAYDVILFNAPYHGPTPQDRLEMSVADEGYRTLERFLVETKRFLRPGGLVVLGSSESGDEGLVDGLLRKNGLRSTEKPSSEWRFDYNCKVSYLTYGG